MNNTVKPQISSEALEQLALEYATGRAALSAQHGSRLSRIPANCWQADVLRGSADMPKAYTPDELREIMKNRAEPVAYLPLSAALTQAVIDRICSESSFQKTIIWEMED